MSKERLENIDMIVDALYKDKIELREFVENALEQEKELRDLEKHWEHDTTQLAIKIGQLKKAEQQNKRYREALFKMDDYDIELGDMREDMQEKLLQIKYIKDKALEGEE